MDAPLEEGRSHSLDSPQPRLKQLNRYWGCADGHCYLCKNNPLKVRPPAPPFMTNNDSNQAWLDRCLARPTLDSHLTVV
jgi:hypothetical protein